MNFIEKRLNLPALPWSDNEERPENPLDELAAISNQQETFEDYQARVQRRLEMLTSDRDLDVNTLIAFWEVFDRVSYGVARENWPEDKGILALQKLRERVQTREEHP